MIKTVLKLILLTFIHAIIFIIINAVMPYSPDFKELGASGDVMGLLFILVN